METKPKDQNLILITRLMQLSLLLLFLSLVLSFYEQKVQIIKYLVYFSFLMFAWSIYFNCSKTPYNIIKHFNQLSLHLWVYLGVLIGRLTGFANTVGASGDVSGLLYDGWAIISIDYFGNLIAFSFILFTMTFYVLFTCKAIRANKRFVIHAVGANTVIFATIYTFQRFIYFFENLV